jgi:O-antigen/teichoic acid export membrane protein
MSWYLAFLPFTGFGIAVLLAREIGRDKKSGDKFMSLTLSLRGCVAVSAALACGSFGWFLESKSEVKSLLIVFSIALIGRSIALWAASVFNAYEANKYTLLLKGIFRTFEVVVGISILIAGGGIVAVATVHAISWWLEAVSGLVLCGRNFEVVRLNWSWHGLKYILANGLPIGIGFVLMNWLHRGVIVLSRHMTISDNSLGQLALAMQVFVIICSIPIAINAASLPVLSRSVMRKDGKDLIFVKAMIRSAFIFGGFLGLAGLGGGVWLVNIVFGARYQMAGYLLGFTLWLIIPWTCANAIWRVYLARGQFFLSTLCAGTGALLFTLIIPWSVSTMDTPGAVFAAGMGMGVWALTLIWLLARSDDLDVKATIFRPLILVLFALGIFFALKSVNVWIALLTSWAVILCGALLFGVITEDERHLLHSLKRNNQARV